MIGLFADATTKRAPDKLQGRGSTGDSPGLAGGAER